MLYKSGRIKIKFSLDGVSCLVLSSKQGMSSGIAEVLQKAQDNSFPLKLSKLMEEISIHL